jgi:protein arginine N-methyltransferase 1
MGHFLLYESMLDSVIYARDKYLKPDGVLMPDRVRSNLAAMTGIDENQKSADFWKDVYGVDMSIMKNVVMAEPAIDKGISKDIVSNTFSYFDIDLYKVKISDLEFANKYSLICSKDTKVMSLISWFDVAFEKVPNKVVFTTSPFTTGTHWMQTIFFLREPIDCKEKDVISGTIAVTKNKREKRDIDIVFTIHHLEEKRRKYLYKLIYV